MKNKQLYNKLNALPLKALQQIAKKAKIARFSSLRKRNLILELLKTSNVEELLTSASGDTIPQNLLIKRFYLTFRKWSIISIKIAGFIVLVHEFVGAIGFGAPWLNATKFISDELRSATFPKYTKTFNILLLPFSPDKDCEIEKVEYERLVKEGLLEKKGKENLDINVSVFYPKSCPIDDSLAMKIGMEENADIVVWGYYDENCADTTKIRLKYILCKNKYFSNIENTYGATSYSNLLAPNDLRSGFLQNNIHDVMYAILGLSEREKNNCHKAIKLFSKMEKYLSEPMYMKTFCLCSLFKEEGTKMALRDFNGEFQSVVDSLSFSDPNADSLFNLNVNKAYIYIDTLIKWYPENWFYQELKIMICLNINRPLDALKELATIKENSKVNVKLSKAKAYRQLGEYGKAKQLLNETEKEGTSLDLVLSERSKIYLCECDFEKERSSIICKRIFLV